MLFPLITELPLSVVLFRVFVQSIVAFNALPMELNRLRTRMVENVYKCGAVHAYGVIHVVRTHRRS